MKKCLPAVISTVIGIAAGLILGYILFKPAAPKVEKAVEATIEKSPAADTKATK